MVSILRCLEQNTVDKLVQRANASLVVGSSSWKEQFIEAITVNPSGTPIYYKIVKSNEIDKISSK